jgi:hypothetical protein
VVVHVGDPENPKLVVVPVAPPTQLAAAVAILDRGYGRPGQAVELTSADRRPVQTTEVDPLEIIQTRLASIRERLLEFGYRKLDEAAVGGGSEGGQSSSRMAPTGPSSESCGGQLSPPRFAGLGPPMPNPRVPE